MFEGDDHIFPAKPEFAIDKKRSNWVKTFVSIAFFIAAFMVLFSGSYLLILEITGILLIHELGHFLMMKKYGYHAVNMFFIPLFGAFVTGEKLSVSQRQKFWISIMGPLPGILLGTVGLIYALNADEPTHLFQLSALLLGINLLNLIPLDPLDGGNIVSCLFFPSKDEVKMYFALISSLIMIVLGVYFELYVITIFGFFMSLKVRGFQKNLKIHKNLEEEEVDYKKPYEDLSNKEYWTIRRIFLENNPKIKEIIPDDFSLWENEKLIVEQVRQILKLEVREDLSLTQKISYFFLFLALLLIPSFIVLSNLSNILAYFAIQ
ncbi:MAG: site-2 protease family protein [Crocinitomicaceae bacterium]